MAHQDNVFAGLGPKDKVGEARFRFRDGNFHVRAPFASVPDHWSTSWDKPSSSSPQHTDAARQALHPRRAPASRRERAKRTRSLNFQTATRPSMSKTARDRAGWLGMKDAGRMTLVRKRGPAVEQPKQSIFTADEFISWALQQPTGRFELESGAVVAMAPERADHATIKGNAFMALRTAIRARGLTCQAFPDGMSVRINDRTVYEPDALVRCGPHLPGDAIEANDPVIIVEVVSPSSRGVDRGVKLASYFSLPSVRHYLIVDTDKRVVIHHRRDEERRIAADILFEGPLTLDPPGFEVDIQDIFDGI